MSRRQPSQNASTQKAGQLKTALVYKLKKFVFALELFEIVTTSCFSTLLKLSFEADISNFKASFLRLDINVTPKLHGAFSHVPDFHKRKRAGLGQFSEQSSEAVHPDFKERWAHYAMPEAHPQYGEKLLQAVLKCNSLHLEDKQSLKHS